MSFDGRIRATAAAAALTLGVAGCGEGNAWHVMYWGNVQSRPNSVRSLSQHASLEECKAWISHERANLRVGGSGGPERRWACGTECTVSTSEGDVECGRVEAAF